MKVETKFNVGDKVFVPYHGTAEVPCDHCLARGRVTVKETGKRQVCGVCFGRKVLYDNSKASWYVAELTIYEVHVFSTRERTYVTYRIDVHTVPPGAMFSDAFGEDDPRLSTTMVEAQAKLHEMAAKHESEYQRVTGEAEDEDEFEEIEK